MPLSERLISLISCSRLSVRPLVRFNAYYDKTGGYLTLDNRGVGPALLQWFEVAVDGRQQRNWPAVINSLGLKSVGKIEQGIPDSGVVMPPSSVDKSTIILAVRPAAAGRALIDQHNRVTLALCYCSLYKECWIARSNANEAEPRKTCEPFPAAKFEWVPRTG